MPPGAIRMSEPNWIKGLVFEETLKLAIRHGMNLEPLFNCKKKRCSKNCLPANLMYPSAISAKIKKTFVFWEKLYSETVYS